MSTRPHPIEGAARLIVNATRAVARRRIIVAFTGLVLTLVIAAAYIVLVGLRVNPARTQIAVNVLLPESGGLIPNQDVTLRGIPIGRVQSINLTDKGVTAVAAIDARYRIPQDTTARVSALSPAGEQYLDFRPARAGGPYLTDGSTVGDDHTAVPVSFHQLLDHAEGVLNQVDPAEVDTIITQAHVGPDGPKKLQAIVDGGTFLISTLDSVLPETVSTLKTSRTVFTTLADVHPGLRATAEDLNQVLAGVNRMDGGFRRFVDTGSAPLTQLDRVIADNSDTMVALLGNLTTVAQLSYVRVPALKALFPTDRGSVLEALASAIRDGGIWSLQDPYPRYSCDY
jgi:virulence factor Mce-like protein